MSADILNTSIEYLKGVGPRRGELLRQEAGIFSFGDLLEFYPFRYVDRSRFYKVSEVLEDYPYVQLRGFISDVELHGQKRATRMTATFTDDSGSLELVWFNGIKWLKNAYKPNVEYIVFGKPSLFNRRFNIVHPEVEPVSPGAINQESAMQPVYNSSEKLRAQGLDSRGIGKLMRTLLPLVIDHVNETLPPHLLEAIRLPDRKTTLSDIHFPSGPTA